MFFEMDKMVLQWK